MKLHRDKTSELGNSSLITHNSPCFCGGLSFDHDTKINWQTAMNMIATFTVRQPGTYFSQAYVYNDLNRTFILLAMCKAMRRKSGSAGSWSS